MSQKRLLLDELIRVANKVKSKAFIYNFKDFDQHYLQSKWSLKLTFKKQGKQLKKRKPTIVTPNPSIIANQNDNKNYVEKKKNKKCKEKNLWNGREKNKKDRTPKTLATESNVKLPGNSSENPNHNQVTYYHCSNKSYYTRNCL